MCTVAPPYAHAKHGERLLLGGAVAQTENRTLFQN